MVIVVVVVVVVVVLGSSRGGCCRGVSSGSRDRKAVVGVMVVVGV